MDDLSGVESMNRILADQMQVILNQRMGRDEVSTNSSSNVVRTVVTANSGNLPVLTSKKPRPLLRLQQMVEPISSNGRHSGTRDF